MESLRRNKPFNAFDNDAVIEHIEPNTKVKIGNKTHVSDDKMLLIKDTGKILYDGRYVAVSGFVFAIVDGAYCVLANMRGEGTPDYQGYWNVPCGYLELNESGREGITREIYEECGVCIKPRNMKLISVETDPIDSNHGNVTLRYSTFLGHVHDIPKQLLANTGAERDEVDGIMWVNVDYLHCYDWAFNHKKVIKKLMPNKWKRRFLVFMSKFFKARNIYNI